MNPLCHSLHFMIRWQSFLCWNGLQGFRIKSKWESKLFKASSLHNSRESPLALGSSPLLCLCSVSYTEFSTQWCQSCLEPFDMLSLPTAPSLSGSTQIPSLQGRLLSLPLGEVSLPSWVELSQLSHFTAIVCSLISLSYLHGVLQG